MNLPADLLNFESPIISLLWFSRCFPFDKDREWHPSTLWFGAWILELGRSPCPLCVSNGVSNVASEFGAFCVAFIDVVSGETDAGIAGTESMTNLQLA